jgi:hypothetical protein
MLVDEAERSPLSAVLCIGHRLSGFVWPTIVLATLSATARIFSVVTRPVRVGLFDQAEALHEPDALLGHIQPSIDAMNRSRSKANGSIFCACIGVCVRHCTMVRARQRYCVQKT